MPIKILHIISDLRRGGRERQLSLIMTYCDQRLYHQHILCLNQASFSYANEYQLSKHITILSSRNKMGRLIEIVRLLYRCSPNIVYAWGASEYLYTLVAWLAVRTYVPINGSVRHGIRSRTLSHFFRMVLLRVSPVVIANSRAGLLANGLKLTKRRFVLYNGVEAKFGYVDPEARGRIRNKLEMSADTLVLISVANFVPYKDYFSILKALRLLKNSRPMLPFAFLAIGSGPMQNEIANATQQMGLERQVHIIGPVVNVPDLLSAADIFIHSSRGEGCSNATLEAMHAGLPVIASDTGGTKEIIDLEYGLLFQYKCPSDLFQKLIEMIEKHDYRMMGRIAKSVATERFGIDTMITNYVRIIQDILSLK